MPARVLFDANVLYRTRLRELILAMGGAGLFQPLWSAGILAECAAGLVRNGVLSAEAADALVGRIRAQGEACLVEGHEHLAGAFGLPDPNDEHVLAAAVHARAEAIVTFNLKDFPAKRLRPHAIGLMTPDAFFRRLQAHAPDSFEACLAAVRTALEGPPSVEDYLAMLRRAGLGGTVKDRRH